MIAITPELVGRTADELRTCGDGRRECVVFWLSSLSKPERVVEVVHPEHSSTPFGYAVDGAWLTRFFFDLADRARTAVAQLHTHPGRNVSPSRTDDEFVLAPSPGFVSIIVPDFAVPFDARGAGVYVLDRDGSWHEDGGAVTW